MKQFLVVAAFALLTSPVAAAVEVGPLHQHVCRGKVIHGSMDSEVGDCIVLSDEPASRKIFTTCHDGDTCEVKAYVVQIEDLTRIERVVSVRKLH